MIILGFLITLISWFVLTNQFTLETLIWLFVGIAMMLHKPIGGLISTYWEIYIERKRHSK